MKNWMKALLTLVTGLALAASAQAAEWNFYGNARIGTFFTDVDKGGSSTTSFTEYLHGNSRIGAKVNVSDAIRGRFEYGASDGEANVRQLWGEWNFGLGKLLVGQTYTPIYMVYSSSVYNGDGSLEKYGAVSASRKPMVRLKFGDFQIAAVEPRSDKLSGSDTKISFPKIEAAYTLKLNTLKLKFIGGYNAYEIDDNHDVDSYIVGLGGKFNWGPVLVAGNVFHGQNLVPYGFKTVANVKPHINGNKLIDSDTFGYTLLAGYTLNDMIKLEGGYGYTESELDESNAKEDDASQYYVQAKFTLAPGVYVIPEIGFVDEGKDKDGNDEGETTYYGAKWQISF